MQLTLKSIGDDSAEFEKAGKALHSNDIKKLQESSPDNPVWVYMDAGRIFQGFITSIAQSLLNRNLLKSGILTLSAYDGEAIKKSQSLMIT